ncbi:MAG: capsular polysaccharide synthesis protein, partial [Clostridiales bacterium]|nr:capsular polysaccharide synthesis protein [Clostridiales bacterium]
MGKLLELVKDRIKTHTLCEEVFGVILWKTNWANKYMCGINSMYKTYTKINKKYSSLIGKNPLKKYECKDMSDTVWICWLQGIENAPKLVQDCYNSIKYHINDRNIVVLNSDNIFKYTDLPTFIIDKWQNGIISNTHFSDIIRVNILLRHGGLWLDSTTYLTDSLPPYITENDFFVYRNGSFDHEMINMGSWLIYSKPNNVLLLETQNLLFEYWKRHNYLQNYFLLHMFFRMVTNHYPKQWNKVPYYNQIDNHILQNEFNKTFDSKRFEQIKEITPI